MAANRRGVAELRICEYFVSTVPKASRKNLEAALHRALAWVQCNMTLSELEGWVATLDELDATSEPHGS